MFSHERNTVQDIRNLIRNLEEEMLPRSFDGDDEVEQVLNTIKRHLNYIESGLNKAEDKIQALEDDIDDLSSKST